METETVLNSGSVSFAEPNPEPTEAEAAAAAKLEHEEAISQRLESLTAEQSKGNDALAKILGNPMVQQVLKAQEEGLDLKLVAEDDDPEPKPETSLDPDAMSNTELMQHVSKTILKEIGTVLKGEVDSRLAPVDTKVDQVLNYLQGREKVRVDDQIKDLRTQFTDFQALEPEMAKIASTAPGLTLKELYTLTKSRSGSPIEPDATLETERPRSSTVRPSGSDSPIGNTRQAFSNELDSVLADLDIRV
jgi:hypothetical protein